MEVNTMGSPKKQSMGCCNTVGYFSKETGEGVLIDYYKGSFKLLSYNEHCSHRNSPCGSHKNYAGTAYRFWRLLTCGCATWEEEFSNAKVAA